MFGYNYAIWCMAKTDIIRPPRFEAKLLPIYSTYYSEQWQQRYYNHWICKLFKYFNVLLILATLVYVGSMIIVVISYKELNGNLLPFSGPINNSSINNGSLPFPVNCPLINNYSVCGKGTRIGSTSILGVIFLFWSYCFYVVCYNQMNKKKLTAGCVPINDLDCLGMSNDFVTVTQDKFKSMATIDYVDKVALLEMSIENKMVKLMIYKPRWWKKYYVGPAIKIVMIWIWFSLCFGFSVYILLLFNPFQ